MYMYMYMCSYMDISGFLGRGSHILEMSRHSSCDSLCTCMAGQCSRGSRHLAQPLVSTNHNTYTHVTICGSSPQNLSTFHRQRRVSCMHARHCAMYVHYTCMCSHVHACTCMCTRICEYACAPFTCMVMYVQFQLKLNKLPVATCIILKTAGQHKLLFLVYSVCQGARSAIGVMHH